jgi:hypothetical protein
MLEQPSEIAPAPAAISASQLVDASDRWRLEPVHGTSFAATLGREIRKRALI